MTTATTIAITVNGESRDLPPATLVPELIRILGLNPELVAVEINRELVRRSAFAARSLADGDRVEIVEFVGGG